MEATVGEILPAADSPGLGPKESAGLALAPKQVNFSRQEREKPRPELRKLFSAIQLSEVSVTQFGGYPLWYKFCHQIGLHQHFARHVRMNRGPLAFTAPEIARFLTDAKVLGAERLMHARSPKSLGLRETLKPDSLLLGGEREKQKRSVPENSGDGSSWTRYRRRRGRM